VKRQHLKIRNLLETLASVLQPCYYGKNPYNNEREDEEMKKFLLKAGITVASCLFFTVLVPILLTSAQQSLFAAGFGIMFVFFAICFYLLMTSTFFDSGKETKTKDETAKDKKAMEPAA
jgi:hypothetical protein